MCLNLYSRKWLRPTGNLVSSLVSWQLCLLNVPLGLAKFIGPSSIDLDFFMVVFLNFFYSSSIFLFAFVLGELKHQNISMILENLPSFRIFIPSWAFLTCNACFSNASTLLVKTMGVALNILFQSKPNVNIAKVFTNLQYQKLTFWLATIYMIS